MSEEISPRWEFDCGHCRFSWCCGPVCACLGSAKPNPKRQCWFPARAKAGEGWISETCEGLGVAEVRWSRLAKGAEVEYRLGARPKGGGPIRTDGKWTKGILTGVTSRWKGTTWGFKILSLKEAE